MPRILIVDDESDNREALTLNLQTKNTDWEFFSAGSESAALEVIHTQLEQKCPIDVVLTDLVMADADSGMVLIQEAQKLDPRLMTILITAKEKKLNRYQAFDYGAFDVVEKTILGAKAAQEIDVKTKAALRYRAWSQQIQFMQRYFDPRLFQAIQEDEDALKLSQRTLTICFWDVRGFSYLCEILKAHPKLLANFLKEYCEIAAKTIFAHNGMLDKFIGDGVMALFGVLNHKDDEGKSDALAAVQAAMALRPKFNGLLKEWNQRWQLYTPHSFEIGLGCGIHTGEALVGNVGTDFRDQFTALGPHVNLAARLESRSESGQILVSQTTQARISDMIATEPAGAVDDIKNIPGTFHLYSVTGVL